MNMSFATIMCCGPFCNLVFILWPKGFEWRTIFPFQSGSSFGAFTNPCKFSISPLQLTGWEFTSTSTLLYEIVIMENVFGLAGLIRLQNFLTCLSLRAPMQAACLCVRIIKKCMGILKGSYHSKLSWSNVHVEAQNNRKPTSVVLFCRFRGSKWRILLQRR